MSSLSGVRRAVAAAAVALVLSAAGCKKTSEKSASFKGGLKSAPGFGSYLFVTSKSGGAGTNMRPVRELWKTFRVETTLGLPDAKHASLGTEGRFGFSVFEASGVGRFFILELIRSGNGIRLEAGTGGPPLGSLEIPDSLVADAVIESVGGLVIFSGRRRGDAEYTPIAAAVAPSPGPYRMSCDILQIPKGTTIGFDEVRITDDGPSAQQTHAVAVRRAMFLAVDALAEAFYTLDGPPAERETAAAALDLAVSRFDAVLAMDLSSLGPVKGQAESARTRTQKLSAGVRGTKSAKKLLKSLYWLVADAGTAADDVE